MKLTRKALLGFSGAMLLAGTALKATGTAAGGRGAEPAKSKSVRWGMAIDTKACGQRSDCQECTRACARAHNVPRIPEARQEVKWIWKEPKENVLPFLRSDGDTDPGSADAVPVLCNHCASPPCVSVCPTQATWKREDGIVTMDFHRCIGCRYCMAACPYGARSFNFVNPRPYIEDGNRDYPTRTAGVVELCNFCQERLEQGQAPACVEACAGKALIFGDLNDDKSEIRELLKSRVVVQRRPELGTGPAVFYLL